MKSLYNTDGIHISKMLRDAHPDGSVSVIDAKEGIVEDSIEAQIKALKTIYKEPMAKVMASLADQLEALGAKDLSQSIDALAYDFYHEAVLIKTSATVSASDPYNDRETVDVAKRFSKAAALIDRYTNSKYGSKDLVRLLRDNYTKEFLDIESLNKFVIAHETIVKYSESMASKRNLLNDPDIFSSDDPSIKREFFEESVDYAVSFLKLVKGNFYNTDIVVRKTDWLDLELDKKRPLSEQYPNHLEALNSLIKALQFLTNFEVVTHDKSGPAADPGVAAPAHQLPDNEFFRRLNSVKEQIDKIQDVAKTLELTGVKEGAINDILKKYIADVAGFRKLYDVAKAGGASAHTQGATQTALYLESVRQKMLALSAELTALEGK